MKLIDVFQAALISLATLFFLFVISCTISSTPNRLDRSGLTLETASTSLARVEAEPEGYIPPAQPLPADATKDRPASPPAALTELTGVLEQTDPTVQAPDSYYEIQGTLRDGDTFEQSLRREKIPAAIRSLIISSLADQLDFRRLKPADTYTATLNEAGVLQHFVYQQSPLDIYAISLADDLYNVQRLPVDLERHRVKISGTINFSLLSAFAEKNEDQRIAYAFADIFASQLDFNTESHKGDTFSLIVDKYYKNGVLVGYGTITAAHYSRQKGESFEAFYYGDHDAEASYYNGQGQAVGTSFLRSPVPIGRLTSKFSYRRKHPITGKSQPHLGIDLAAPVGTPIMAAADGRISFIGSNNGNGKQIIITHNGGYKSYYGHLSRFKKGLKKGSSVRQKDIIGYVGSSGLSTGPHLDYRIQQAGIFKNPFSLQFTPKAVLKDEKLVTFRRQIAAIKATLVQFAASDEVLQVDNLTLASTQHITLL